MQITGFELIEKLGEGGMAAVWKARQISLDRIVAIKVLSSAFAHDPSDVERFQVEAKSAAKLKHPGIIQVHDANAESGLYYFVMEYVAGYTVGDWLRRKGTLGVKDALLIVNCVADALDYAWTKERIVHCDIKPDNIMIDEDGTIKVADLGLARTIGKMSAKADSEYVLGTPCYMSPEQARGDSDLDCRSDIYSLGAMLYHALTGKMMFEESPPDEVLDRQISANPVDPHRLNRRLSKPVCALIQHMIAKDRAARPQTWADVKEEVGRVGRGMLPRGAASAARAEPARVRIVHVDHSGLLSARHAKTAKTTRQKTMAIPATKPSSTPIIAAAVVAGVVLVLALLGAAQQASVRARQARTARHQTPHVLQEQALDARLRAVHDAARAWADQNSDRIDDAIDRLRDAAERTRGSKYENMALEHIKTLERAKKKKQTDVVAALRDRALEYAREGKIEQAIRYLETYSGELASETSRERLSMANQLRGKLRAKEAEGMKRAEERVAAVERRLSEAMDRVASELVASGIPAARTALNEAARDPDLKEKAKDLAAIQELFDRAENIDRRVLSSFQAQRGQTVAVELKTGRKMFHITEAEGNRITYEVRSGAGMASVSMSFGLDDLAPRERLGRMGDDSLPDVALVKGLMALQGGVSAHARKYLAMTPPLLSARLLASVDAAGQKAAEAKAEDALREMLKDFGIAVSAGFDAAAWVHAVENAAFTREKAARLGPALELFRQDHGATYFAQRASAVIEALDQIRNDAGPAVSVENRSSD